MVDKISRRKTLWQNIWCVEDDESTDIDFIHMLLFTFNTLIIADGDLISMWD